MLYLTIVRHGETEWNRVMRVQGHSDIPLTELGCRQAELTSAHILREERPPDRVFTSDLCRAAATAAPLSAASGAAAEQTPLLRETMLGDWEGLTHAEIHERGDGDRLHAYRADPLRHRPPGAESLEDVWDRMQTFAERYLLEQAGHVVIVGHGGSLRALICAALGGTVRSMQRMWLDNGSITRLQTVHGIRSGSATLVTLNYTRHLAGARGETAGN